MALVSRWQLNETSGSVADDPIGGRDGTYNGPTLNQAGIVPAYPEDGCPSFDGSNDRVEIADHSSLRFTTAFSVKAWIYWDGDEGFVISKGEEDWGLFITSGGSIEVFFTDSGGTLRTAATAGGTLTNPGTYCIHGTHEQNVETRVYVNGVQKATAKLNFAARTSTKAVWIGQDLGSSAGYHLKGRLARVEAHNSRLTLAQVEADYAADATPPEEEGETYEASATGSGTGSGSATALVAAQASAAGSGVGTGTAAAIAERAASAAGQGTGTGAAAANVVALASASGQGAGVGTANGEVEGAAAGGRIAVIHEYPPDALAWRIDPPAGQSSRWAADEPLAENVIDNIRLSDEMPGGDKEGTGVLARNPRTPWPDLAPYSNISVYGPGVEEVGSYRLDKAPESDGERMAISPAAVGWSAALEDDRSIIGPGFIDGDLGKWEEPSAQRRLNISAAGYAEADTSVEVGRGGAGEAPPGIVFTLNLDKGGKHLGERWNFGGGVDLGALLYDFAGAGKDTAWEDNAAASSDDLVSSYDAGTEHDQVTAAQQRLDSTIAGRKYIRIRSAREGGFGTQTLIAHAWNNLRILGWGAAQNLALQGEWPNVGYTAAQMLAYAIPLYTPLRAEDEDLEDSGYVIQQAWYSDPGPLSAVVTDLTKYELLDWFVFGGKRFQLRFPGTYGRRWQAYAGPSGLQEQGEDAARSWRSITVSYQDVDGRTYTVGPPGSGATVEDEGLEVTDPDHPAVRAELTRKDLLALRGISTATRAIEAGERWLAEANLLSRSGSATLSGYILDDRGVYRPVSQLRAGDQIRFPDAADRSYRKVVRRNYDHSTRTVTVDLDAPAEGIQALLERMQADIQSLQIG